MDRRDFLTTMAATGGLASARLACGAQSEPNTNTNTAATPIPRRRLGRTGVDVTVLEIGGVVGMMRKPSDRFDPAQLAEAALDAGIQYFDTAPGYGGGQSERNYGRVIARRRKEVFLATKTGQRSYDGVFRALQKLRDQKVTRFIGVTGHESADVMCRAITMYEFDTVFTTFNPTEKRRSFIEKVLPLAVGNPIKNDGIARHDEAASQATAGMLIRYAIALPITVAVVGMGSLEHLRENVRAACSPALDDEQRKALEVRMAS